MTRKQKVKPEIKFRLAFSGGGFRATLFCLGAYRRIVELGLHQNIESISSVSGGSIAAGQILNALSKKEFSSIKDFDERVTAPIKRLCQCRFRNLIMKKIVYPLAPRRRFSQQLPILLDRFLFNNMTIKDLPDEPEWSVNTTCLNSGKRVRFKKKDFGGNIIGHSTEFKRAKVSYAVACSAAFPMMFAPIKLFTKDKKFTFKYKWQKERWGDMPEVPNTLYLSDGGVYDNLGSEGLFHTNNPFIILDASSFLEDWDIYSRPNWFSRNWRQLETGLDQIVLLRRRLIYYQSKEKKGCQLILRDPVSVFLNKPEAFGSLSDSVFDLPAYELMSERNQKLLGRIRTDFDGFHDIEIECLMWSGAVRIDIAIKKYLMDLIDQTLVNDFPKLPEYEDVRVTKILERGTKRKILNTVHHNLKEH